MALLSPESEPRVLLRGVSWELYQHMQRELRGGTRLCYDHGMLEIMSPTRLHEAIKTILGRLIEAFCDEMGITVEGFGSTTFDREDLSKGIEPDECYYITNAKRVIGREELDMTVDPPPDLAIEVDISPPSTLRQPTYAALGVPEVWRYDGCVVIPLIRVVDASGAHYEPAENNLAFPQFPMTEVNRLLQVGLKEGQTAAVKALREWIGRGRRP